ncbi:MAG: hypothetical protein PT116_24030 [Aphanizomenon gracile PMC638.10]|nr:hypothetical protein [Aphanizomenon gracile PMC638.10]
MATLQDTTAIILARSHQFLKPMIAPYIPKKRTDKSALALSPLTSPNSELTSQRSAIALTSQKQRSPSQPQTANCLQQRFAIAPPHPPKSDRPPHPLKAIAPHIPKQRTACSSASLSPSTSPTAIALTTSPKSELLAAALRYRPPHPQQRSLSPHPQKEIAPPHPKK